MIAALFAAAVATSSTDGKAVRALLDQAVAECSDQPHVLMLFDFDFIGDPFVRKGTFPFESMVRRTDKPSALAQLIAMGPKAVSELTWHLRSSKETSYEIGTGGFTRAVEYFSYDPKRPDVASEPWPNFGAIGAAGKEVTRYRICEGDLAYFAIGEIVNRWYMPIRGGGMYVLCSPVRNPELARHVIDDWRYTTPEDLLDSLKRDVVHCDSSARMELGIRRLATYFPSKVEDIAVAAFANIRERPDRQVVDGPPNRVNFFLAIEPIASPRLDKECVRLLGRLERWQSPSASLGSRVLNYLRKRPGYLETCVLFAKGRIQRKDDAMGQYAQFLSLYAKKDSS